MLIVLGSCLSHDPIFIGWVLTGGFKRTHKIGAAGGSRTLKVSLRRRHSSNPLATALEFGDQFKDGRCELSELPEDGEAQACADCHHDRPEDHVSCWRPFHHVSYRTR